MKQTNIGKPFYSSKQWDNSWSPAVFAPVAIPPYTALSPGLNDPLHHILYDEQSSGYSYQAFVVVL